MQKRIAVYRDSSPAWIKTVLANFESFLQDHADCERKASAMATSLIAKYADRKEIIAPLIETAIEELEHFKEVYDILNERGIMLNKEMQEDVYVQQLIAVCRNGREERFLDRLLLGSVLECRGAERFRLIYENVNDDSLKQFYHKLWASEAKHGEVFVTLALKYFKEEIVYDRLDTLMKTEAEVINKIPIRPALH